MRARRCRDYFGELAGKFHSDTERYLVKAELFGAPSVRCIEPVAPFFWALAIESEFHQKIYRNNQKMIDEVLDEGRREKRSRKSCGISEIGTFISKTTTCLRRPIMEKIIPAWGKVIRVREIVSILRTIQEDRNQIVHATASGPYTKAQCDRFISRIRDSGWLVEFMSSLQP